MSDLLIAIDPGDLTGYVVVNKKTAEVYESVEIGEWTEVAARVEELLVNEEDGNITVVMEKFTINANTHKKTAQPAVLDIIGSVKWVYERHTGKKITMQTPADAKSFATNDKLKAIGFWHVGGKGHANDAFRHALTYMVRSAGFMDRRLLVEYEEE